MLARINVWSKDCTGIDEELAGNTYLYIKGTHYTWCHIQPSEKLSAVLSLLTPELPHSQCRCLSLEADLVHELGFEVVRKLGVKK